MKLTPRIFKTPKREYTKKQETDFITKYRTHLKNNHLLNTSETSCIKNNIDNDPFWLKEKADDYLYAIHAYSDIVQNIKSLNSNNNDNHNNSKKEEAK